jgi:hypothetical protein
MTKEKCTSHYNVCTSFFYEPTRIFVHPSIDHQFDVCFISVDKIPEGSDLLDSHSILEGLQLVQYLTSISLFVWGIW